MNERLHHRSRRDFLKASGALVVGFSARAVGGLAQHRRPRRCPAASTPTACSTRWLRINPNGTVTVFTGKIELGQGILTALAQIAADELDVDLRAHRDGHRRHRRARPTKGMTAGSQSVENSGTALRFACAEAREMLLAAAGREARRRRRRARRSATAPLPRRAAPAPPTGSWRATSIFKREATARGEAEAAGRSTGVSARASRAATSRRSSPAARPTCRTSGCRACCSAAWCARRRRARSWCRRRSGGRGACPASWRWCATAASSPSPPSARSRRSRRATRCATSAKWQETAGAAAAGRRALRAHAASRAAARDGRERESRSPRRRRPSRRVEARLHAPLSSATPRSARRARSRSGKDGKLTVWTHSQGVFPLRARSRQRVRRRRRATSRCIHAEGAGCYGHNGADDVALDAALRRARDRRPAGEAAVDARRRVRVGTVRLGHGDEAAGARSTRRAASSTGSTSCGAIRIRTRPGPADGANLLAALASRQAASRRRSRPTCRSPPAAADRNAVPLYDFPNAADRRSTIIPEMPLRTSALRTLGAYANVFALESFIDELAAAAGADPVEFRLRHMKDPRARAVIEAAAQQSGLEAEGAKATARSGRGFALRADTRTSPATARWSPTSTVDRAHRSGARHAGGGRRRRGADHQPRRRHATRSRAASSSRRAGR